MNKKKDRNPEEKNERKPWIPRNTGYVAMAIVSIALAVWTAWQVIATEQNIGKGIMWGMIFGVSIWLVFFGMNFFHSLFGGKKNK